MIFTRAEDDSVPAFVTILIPILSRFFKTKQHHPLEDVRGHWLDTEPFVQRVGAASV